jgi:hypothetical protein
MTAPTKLGAFAVALVAVFAAAAGIGRAVGPTGTTGPETTHADTAGGGHEPTGPERTDRAEHAPKGLMVSDAGYTLALTDPTLAPAGRTPVRFRISGPDGRPVTRYDRTHDKDLHLIVVRRDLVGYQHVHPTLDPTGTWSAPLDLSRPGSYRVFADFAPAGHESMTLGADLSVPGRYDPRPLPEPSRTSQVDGYTVTLEGTLTAGRESELTLSVSREGRPVTDLEPYLAAYGHLVALRSGDLGYLHVHPGGGPGDGRTAPGPDITFYAQVPSAGDYRLFLDFRHGGVVRTAEFTARAR